MRPPQEICTELFLSKAYSCMANGENLTISIIKARGFAARIFPEKMLDNAELDLYDRVRAWEKIT